MSSGKCRRCRRRWAQHGQVCRSCENAIIEEQARKAAESPDTGPAPSYAKPGGNGVQVYIPGLIGLSFFGTVFNRR